MKVKFFDLQRQYSKIGSEIEKSTIEILRSGNYVSGNKVREFEEKFAEYCGVQYCCAVNTGTAALDLAIRFFQFNKNSHILTQSNSFIATTEAILYNNLFPDFLDVDENGLLNINLIPQNDYRIMATVPVNLYGNPVDTRKIKNNRHIILDACQSHGAKIDNIDITAFADVTCFSFYPGKNLGACGEGGALVTDKKDLYDFAIKMRSHGQPQKYIHDEIGYNYRLDEIQAAILTIKLKYLEEWTEKRIEIAKRYNKNLSGNNKIRTLQVNPNNRCVYHIFPVFVHNRDYIIQELLKSDIQTGIHYPIPIHLQEATKNLGYQDGQFPNVEIQSNQEISLPMYPELTNDEVDYVCEKLLEVI
jgi:dTDP-4-amino-4,6-dideoxygalactose transaminase